MLQLRGRALLLAVTTLTSLGFFLIGFDNGLMGGLVNGAAFNKTFDDPDPDMVANIVSLYESEFPYSSTSTSVNVGEERPDGRVVGCFFGSIFSSVVGERMGRIRSIGFGVSVMIVGALLQATAYSRAHMIIARIITGIGMGTINSTTPVLQVSGAEIQFVRRNRD
jgi:MFS family permease